MLVAPCTSSAPPFPASVPSTVSVVPPATVRVPPVTATTPAPASTCVAPRVLVPASPNTPLLACTLPLTPPPLIVAVPVPVVLLNVPDATILPGVLLYCRG